MRSVFSVSLFAMLYLMLFSLFLILPAKGGAAEVAGPKISPVQAQTPQRIQLREPEKSPIASALEAEFPRLEVKSEIRYMPYTYDYGHVARDFAKDAFVICSNCPRIGDSQARKARLASTNPLLSRVSLKAPVGVEEGVTVYFAFDSAVLTAYEETKLNSFKEGDRVRVEGHTCSTGPKKHNKELSKKRAAAVAKKLKHKKVVVVSIEGKGATCPVSSNKEKNRRAVVKIVKEAGK